MVTTPVQPGSSGSTSTVSTTQVPPTSTQQDPNVRERTDAGLLTQLRLLTPQGAQARYQRSPIERQHRDERTQAHPAPVEIIFLSGPYIGKSLDLGTGVIEVSNEQNADWGRQEGKSIRVGQNFNNLTPRTFSFSITYYDLSKDISHLCENVATLHEMGDGQTEPPKIAYTQGAIGPIIVVCTAYKCQYSDPFPGGKGYHQGKVDLTFELLGGKASEHSLGKPLAPTPLNDARVRTTQDERRRQGQSATTSLLLADCLGPASSRALGQLLSEDKLQIPEIVLRLNPEQMVQAAIGGLIPQNVLNDPRVKEKLARDLATVMAQNEDGAGISSGQLAQAIRTGQVPASLRSRLQPIVPQAHADYKVILDAVQKQDLGQSSSVFDRTRNPTAAERLSRLGSCGLRMRQAGGSSLATSPDPERDAKVLAEINKLLADPSTSDEQLRQNFGNLTPGQLRALRNGGPYTSKDQFVTHATRQGDSITGYVLWSRFAEANAKEDDKE